jgi:hypothetical protein
VEEAAQKIVVYDSYDTVIQANLVKTKLDAYGIPCFLSEENFTSWYPFRNQLFPGVRLHIFEKDFVQVKEVLTDDPFPAEETYCPYCRSGKISIEETEKDKGFQLLVALFLFIAPRKRVYRCHDCTREWE